MTVEQKSQICTLRCAGRTYAQIARALSMSEATVKTFCYRNGITVTQSGLSVQEPKNAPVSACAYCGVEIKQAEHRKRKRFCSDACRMKWWNQNRARMASGGKLEKHCPVCHAAYFTYDKNRKYCSHSCYVQARYGGNPSECEIT